MNLCLTKDRFNFHEMIERIQLANDVTIVTYCMVTDENSALVKALRGRPASGTTTIITNIPARFNQYYNTEARSKASRKIEDYISKLAPSNFDCAPAVWFCFSNHAKIIICDDLLYVGSANFTLESKNNFEAGIVTRNPRHLRSGIAFLERLKADSIPYWNADTAELRRLFALATSIPALVDEAAEMVCTSVADRDGDSHLEFQLDRFALLPTLIDAIETAKADADVMEERQGEDGSSTTECRLVDAGITQLVGDLHEEMTRLTDGLDWPERIDEQHLADKLFEKYAHVSSDGNPDEIQAAFQDELRETLEANEKEREDAARKQTRAFLKKVKQMRGKILSIFQECGANPKVNNAK